ncbi:MAG TPA: hypothetical protein VHA14_09495 [Bryobacteraceae bacterium]|nr:hypothetical protein [Bryobacteraceae bacterium]
MLTFRAWYYRLDAAVALPSEGMRLVILHYHLFKNAGSTIEEMLDHSFHGRFRRIETADASGIVTDRDLLQHIYDGRGVQAVTSHQIRYPMPQAAGCLFFDICFVRDPLDRLRSFYDYFRQRPDPSNPISVLANQCAMGEFAARMIREQPLFVRNNQVNLLACGGDSDEPGERDLDLAIRRLQAAAFPGVVDCFEQSIAAGAVWLGQAFPELDLDRAAVNVSRGMEGSVESRIAGMREACEPEIFEQLMRMTALDRLLVSSARAEVLRRFREVEDAGQKPGGSPGQPAEAPPHGGVIQRFGRERKLRAVFDSVFYLEKNSDVRAAGIDPLRHYLAHGAAEDRAPHPLFDSRYYRITAGVSEGVNPLEHFLDAGAWAASPHPLFSCEAYRRAYPEVIERNVNPLVHYLRSGRFRNEGDVEIQNVRIRIDAWEPQQTPFLRAVAPDQLRANSR